MVSPYSVYDSTTVRPYRAPKVNPEVKPGALNVEL